MIFSTIFVISIIASILIYGYYNSETEPIFDKYIEIQMAKINAEPTEIELQIKKYKNTINTINRQLGYLTGKYVC